MKRVLVVEDHADIRKLIRMTLEFEDYEIHEAADAAAGLGMVDAIAPDVVVLDVMMPGSFDGLQLCERIKQVPGKADIKVVMLTARGQEHDVEAGRRAGADDYIVKPFSPLQLIGTIETLLGPP